MVQVPFKGELTVGYIVVYPGKEVEVSVENKFAALAMGLTLLDEDDPVDTADEMAESDDNSYSDKIASIKGIGKKTAKDIQSVFPQEDDLIEALKGGDDLPFRDDVAEKLKKFYGFGEESKVQEAKVETKQTRK